MLDYNGYPAVTNCCDKEHSLTVCKSAAGYYLGYVCDECGSPLARCSHYFRTAEAAQAVLEDTKNDSSDK